MTIARDRSQLAGESLGDRETTGVDGQDRSRVFGRQIEGMADLADASAVHEDVGQSSSIARFAKKFCPGVRSVTSSILAPAPRGQGRGHVVRGRAVAIRHDRPCAARCQQPGRRCADPAAAAGNQGAGKIRNRHPARLDQCPRPAAVGLAEELLQRGQASRHVQREPVAATTGREAVARRVPVALPGKVAGDVLRLAFDFRRAPHGRRRAQRDDNRASRALFTARVCAAARARRRNR